MRARAQWSYAQARLQARHGERPGEADWHALEAARSVDQYLERTRATSLRRFTERLDARMEPHAIERILRDARRAYVAETAGWVPKEWRGAMSWTACLAELPEIEAAARDGAPGWLGEDPAFADFTEARGEDGAASPLVRRAGSGEPLAALWYRHWLTLRPRGARDDKALDDLVATVAAHAGRLRDAGPEETSAPYRGDLARRLSRLFRRHGASPVAAFSHLGLVALDFERLRGGILRRRLFGPVHARVAA